jgi:hypothetical protein
MRHIRVRPGKKACSGAAAIEFAIILPLLLLLGLSIFDIARGIQANMILVSVAREGGSLAARPTGYSYTQVMDALADTTPPLDMKNEGMIYITKIMGYSAGGAISNIVLEQHRWQKGWAVSGYVPTSSVWNCGASGGTSWGTDGACAGLPSPSPISPIASVMTGQLADGEVIYTVETYYRYQSWFGNLQVGGGLKTTQVGPGLYSMAIF